MECIINHGYDIASRQIKKFISFTADEHRIRGEKLAKLYEDSINRKMPTIKEGEVGSMNNPFANVDEAADFILKMEKEYLESDGYRQK